MKTQSPEINTVRMRPELLAEARIAAIEEHRPADELVSAVQRYLQQRKQTVSAPLISKESVKQKRLSELLASLRGVDIDLRRNPSVGRPVHL